MHQRRVIGGGTAPVSAQEFLDGGALVVNRLDRRKQRAELLLIQLRIPGDQFGLTRRQQRARVTARQNGGVGLAARDRMRNRLQRPLLSLIHISEPTRQAEISYAVFCLKK